MTGRETGQNSQISVRGNHVPAGLLPGRDPLLNPTSRSCAPRFPDRCNPLAEGRERTDRDRQDTDGSLVVAVRANVEAGEAERERERESVVGAAATRACLR